ncbi:MAG: hypothetical protein JSS79_07940 [Bacteroidetes bacterium]|nr:hypothetical protein [Bacteroidota bacterium]
MIRKANLWWVVLVMAFPLTSLAQSSNSWINFNQSYYKIPVSRDGIYRLSYTDLQTAGFPVASVDPRFIQLFRRGKEQAIYIKGQGDGKFNTSDYLEFFGQKNDGTLDSSLYQQPSQQPHKYYNLYSDTSAYFLTFSSVPPRGLRMDSVQFVNVNNQPAETFQYAQRLLIVHDYYSPGYTFNDLTQATAFDQGEGWTGTPLRQGKSTDYVIDSVYNGVQSAGNPKLELLLVGSDPLPHSLQVFVGPYGGSRRLIDSPNFSGFGNYVLSTDLTWSDVSSDGRILIHIVGQTIGTDRNQASVSYIKITYPQNFDLTSIKNKTMQLAVNPQASSYLVFSNAASGTRVWDITDPKNLTRIQPTSTTSPLSVMVPATSSPKNIFVSNSYNTPAILPVSFTSINTASDFVIITHKSLTSAGGGYSNPVQAYADYRATTAGGSYHPLVVTVDQLYNQFNYGETSPLGIYNFVKYLIAQGNPKYLFLVGKGRDITFSLYQRQPLLANELLDLVPSAGFPGGDIAYTAGLKGTTYEPAVPTGRLSASTPAQIAAYLNKVIEIESKPLQPFAKELLHLSGGGSSVTDAQELIEFKGIVDGFKAIAEGPYLGGHVSTQSKQNVGVEKINVSQTINAGVNLVTFFGHSSSSTIDIDIGYVSDATLGYNNPGKYPVFLINGCNAGTIFSNEVTFSEDWMMAAKKGSRNFIASTSFGLTYDLQTYSTLFYNVGFADSSYIQRGIGDIQKEVGRRFLGNGSLSDIISVAQVQQMVLAGDPSLKLFGTNLPDYSVENGAVSLVSLDGKPINSLSASFGVQVIVKNLGATSAKPVKIRVIRTFKDNSTKTYDSTFLPISYIDTVTIVLKKGTGIEYGNNLFTVQIDPLSTIKEITKANNTAAISYFIPSNSTINLYPSDYGIVGSSNVNFLLQSEDLLGGGKNFEVQVDTVNTFNSPYLTKFTPTGNVLVKQPVNLLTKDSVVYYWRSRPAKQSTSDSSQWSTSSFVFINGSPEGWAQSRFEQQLKNSFTNLDVNLAQKKINFTRTTTSIAVKSVGASSPSGFTAASMKIDGTEYNVTAQVPCRNNTINLVAFNKTTAAPYPGISFYNNDSRGCGLQPSVINSFLGSEVETGNADDLLTYIDNIQLSDSVVLYSVGNPQFSTWSQNVLDKLGLLGISNSQITSLTDGQPMIIFGKKGATAGSAKLISTSTTPVTAQDASTTSTITGINPSGAVASTLIGPAKKWIKFSAKAKLSDGNDKISYSIYGVDLKGTETLLELNLTGNNHDLSYIDPTTYPQLKIVFLMSDNVSQNAAQLKNWFVMFESVADGLIYFQGPTTTQSVPEGEPFTSRFGFVNISSKTFTDSLVVNQTVTMANAVNESSSFKIKAPAPGDTTKFSTTIATQGKRGLNTISVYVNPKIQPEQYYENNLVNLTSYLNVIPDLSAPVLDVSIDGRYVENGDYISPNPVIKVKLHDDNPFLFVTDTTHVTLLLSYPCSSAPCSFKRINFSRKDVVWTSATATSDFTVTFTPANLPEGTYTLQVTGTDAVGNKAGTQPYEVSFTVKNETSITLSSVYPNPSTDVFTFNFVLSGNVLPDNFLLQIYALDGRLVEQFESKDIGQFIIGHNQLPWSAVNSGIKEGMLLYKLQVTTNGKKAEQHGKLIFAR